MSEITQYTIPVIPNHIDAGNFNKDQISQLDSTDSIAKDINKAKITALQEISLHVKNLQASAKQILESQNNLSSSKLRKQHLELIQGVEPSKDKASTSIIERQLIQLLDELTHANLEITSNTSKTKYDNELLLLSKTSETISQAIDYSTTYNNSPVDEASILAMAAEVSNAMVELSYNVAVSLTKLTQSFQGVMDMLASLQKILSYVNGYYISAIACHNSNKDNKEKQMATWDFGSGDEGLTNFDGSDAGREWAGKVHLDGGRAYLTGLEIPNNVKKFFQNGQIDEDSIENLLKMVSSTLAAILPDSASFYSTNKGAQFNSATIQTFIDNCGTKIKSVNDLLSTYTNQIETAQNAAQQGLSFFSSINNIMNQLIQKLF